MIAPIARYPHTNRVIGVAFAPDNAVLAGGYDAIVLWDPAGTPRWRRDGFEAWHFAYSPDAATVIAGGHGNLLVELDAATGATRRTFPVTTNVFSVALSPDGTRIASGGRPQLEIWDRGAAPLATIQCGKPTKVHTPTVSSVAFSRDGTRVVATCGKAAAVYAIDGTRSYTANVDRFGAQCAAFAADDTIITVGTGSTIELRDPARKTKQPVRSFAPPSKTRTFALGAGGTQLLTGGEGNVHVLELATGRVVSTLTGPEQGVDAVALSRDGSRAAAVGLDNAVFVWDLGVR